PARPWGPDRRPDQRRATTRGARGGAPRQRCGSRRGHRPAARSRPRRARELVAGRGWSVAARPRCCNFGPGRYHAGEMRTSGRTANTPTDGGQPLTVVPEAGEPTEGPQSRDSDFVQSLDRGLAVIRAFGPDRERLSLSEVARATGLTRAAARRFLLTLVKLGYVRSDGREFSLRPKVLELGYAYLS